MKLMNAVGNWVSECGMEKGKAKNKIGKKGELGTR